MKDTDAPVTAEGGTTRPVGGGPTRVTVNLTRKAADALEELSDSTGYSKTDTINRALQVYAIIQGFLDKGASLVVKPEDAGPEIRLHIV